MQKLNFDLIQKDIEKQGSRKKIKNDFSIILFLLIFNFVDI